MVHCAFKHSKENVVILEVRHDAMNAMAQVAEATFNLSTETAQSRRFSSELKCTPMDTHNLFLLLLQFERKGVSKLTLEAFLFTARRCWSLCSARRFTLANQGVSSMASLCSYFCEARRRAILTQCSSLAIYSSSAVVWFAIFRRLSALKLHCEKLDILARGIENNTVADIADFVSIIMRHKITNVITWIIFARSMTTVIT